MKLQAEYRQSPDYWGVEYGVELSGAHGTVHCVEYGPAQLMSCLCRIQKNQELLWRDN